MYLGGADQSCMPNNNPTPESDTTTELNKKLEMATVTSTPGTESANTASESDSIVTGTATPDVTTSNNEPASMVTSAPESETTQESTEILTTSGNGHNAVAVALLIIIGILTLYKFCRFH